MSFHGPTGKEFLNVAGGLQRALGLLNQRCVRRGLAGRAANRGKTL
jgi:hypothetical protein